MILTKDSLAKAVDGYPSISESITAIAQERFSSYVKQKKAEQKVDFGDEINLSMTQNDLKNVSIFKRID